MTHRSVLFMTLAMVGAALGGVACSLGALPPGRDDDAPGVIEDGGGTATPEAVATSGDADDSPSRPSAHAPDGGVSSETDDAWAGPPQDGGRHGRVGSADSSADVIDRCETPIEDAPTDCSG